MSDHCSLRDAFETFRDQARIGLDTIKHREPVHTVEREEREHWQAEKVLRAAVEVIEDARRRHAQFAQSGGNVDGSARVWQAFLDAETGR